jgi:hypothetical protein
MLVTPVPMLGRLMTADLHPGEVVVEVVQEELHDARMQARLVPFDGQHRNWAIIS